MSLSSSWLVKAVLGLKPVPRRSQGCSFWRPDSSLWAVVISPWVAGGAARSLCRRCLTQSSADLGLFPPRRAVGTRCDAGRVRFLRVDNRLPAAARTPGARLLHAHARARASTRHPQHGAVLATVVGRGRGRWHLRRRLRTEVQVCLRRPTPWHVPSSTSYLKCLAKGRDFIPWLTGKEEAWAGFRSAGNEKLRTLLVP